MKICGAVAPGPASSTRKVSVGVGNAGMVKKVSFQKPNDEKGRTPDGMALSSGQTIVGTTNSNETEEYK